MISSSFDFLLQLELENFYFYWWKMSISVFKLFYKHNMLIKESYMGFRACELNSSENQFSPVTSPRFLNHRRWPVPSFSGTYFVCICEHIFLTRYNELFLGKGTKIAIKFFTQKQHQEIKWWLITPFVRLQKLLVEKHPFRVAPHIFVRD